MARRKSQSALYILLDGAAAIPWWADLILAILSYLGFHYVTGLPVSKPQGLQGLSDSVIQVMYTTAASLLQYIVPIAFIGGSVVSLLKRTKRNKLLDSQTGIESIRAMPWQEFELLVGEAFRRLGFQVSELGGPGADGGVDLVLFKEGKKYIVQCKRWKTFTVSVQPVRELYGVMHAQGADGCIFVSSGRYTRDAMEFAHSKPIELLDGPRLVRIVRLVQDAVPVIPEAEVTPSLVSCPVCGGAMVKRLAKRGTKAGQEFWGCQKYPACRGTVN